MKNLILTVVSLSLLFLLLEIVVPKKYSSTEIYRSAIYKKRFSNRLDWVNGEFRDRSHDSSGLVKGLDGCPTTHLRVLVVGDSLVYGKGAPVNTTWDAQLAHMVKASGSDVCVISIGKNGWTTMDEFDFLKQNWGLLHPDYVIFGYVTNDPDFKDIDRKYWFKHGPAPCRRVYPLRLANFIGEKVCFIMQVNHRTIGYPQWESLIHEPKNLSRYRDVLLEIREFLQRKKVPFHFLLTRKSWEHGGEEFHSRISRLMTDVGISHTDTLPMILRFFSPFPDLFRWTHPGDGHPSALVNSFFAWHAYDHLCQMSIVDFRCEEFRQKVIAIND